MDEATRAARALWQALERYDAVPGVAVYIDTSSTSGDEIIDATIHVVGECGVFLVQKYDTGREAPYAPESVDVVTEHPYAGGHFRIMIYGHDPAPPPAPPKVAADPERYEVGDGSYLTLTEAVDPTRFNVTRHTAMGGIHVVRHWCTHDEAVRAMRRTGAFYKGFARIRAAGAEAAKAGQPREAPYEDSRTWRGSITFNRARIREWLDGYDSAKGGA